MNKNTKGFTLIELLAVIVILAIIALIATPMILGVIDSAKKGAAESSAYGYLDAVEKSSLQNVLKDANTSGLVDGTYAVSDNGKKLTQTDAEEGVTPVAIDVNFKGDYPKGSSDTIKVLNGVITEATLSINGYTVTYNGTKATASAS